MVVWVVPGEHTPIVREHFGAAVADGVEHGLVREIDVGMSRQEVEALLFRIQRTEKPKVEKQEARAEVAVGVNGDVIVGEPPELATVDSGVPGIEVALAEHRFVREGEQVGLGLP